MYQRETYSNIKQYFLNYAFNACAAKFCYGAVQKWSEDETEYGYADYNFEHSFDLPIENLMWYVISIIADAGRTPHHHLILLQDIHHILKKHDLNELTNDLDEEEKEEFLYELNLVLNNSKLLK